MSRRRRRVGAGGAPAQRGGRRPLLTPQVEEKFLNALRTGNTYADAARVSGIAPETAEKWMRRGRGLLPGRPAAPEYVRFVKLAEEAKVTAKVVAVGNLHARSRTDTPAALAWLKRFGGPEWADDPTPAPGLLQAGDTVIEHQANFMVVVPPEAIPDFVRQQLAARRQQMASIAADEVAPPSIPLRLTDGNGARSPLERLVTDSGS